MRRRSGLTLVETAISVAVLSILALVALPGMKLAAKRADEYELRAALRAMRSAIDRHFDAEHALNPGGIDALKYPKSLEALIERRLLRRIPEDPLSGKAEWRFIASTDPPDSRYTTGDNVWDVRTLSEATALDGTRYDTW